MPHVYTRSRWFAFGMMWLLVLCVMGVIAANRFNADDLRMQKLEADGTPSAERPSGRVRIAVAGDSRQQTRAQLRFTLPAPDTAQSRWVIRLARNPVDAVWLQRDGWSGTHRDFFHPHVDEGLMPAGFVLPLPSDWQGDVVLALHATGDIDTVLQPRLMRESAALRLGQRAIAFDSAIYAGLFVLAMLALALFAAARERSFLALFGCTSVTLLLLSAENGHLYALPGFGVFALWHGEGLWALELLFCASVVQMLLRYADLREGVTRAVRGLDEYCVALAVMAALCLLNLRVLHPLLQLVVTIAWVGTGITVLVILADAVRRRVPMAWPVLVLATIAVLAMGVRYALVLGWVDDGLWTRRGYELAFTATAAMVAIGLISRIGEYRDQRDHADLERIDSERRMEREAARTALTLALQTRLRALAAADIEWTAFHLLLEHLMPQVPVDAAAVVANGYHGHDVVVVEPAAHKDALHKHLAARHLWLKRQATSPVPLQQVIPDYLPASIEAVLPLPIRAPAWGALVLQRTGTTGFTTQELDMAGEFARLAVLHADESLAAFQLRRSAELDALTGAFNRRSIDQWLARMFVDAHRKQRPLSLLFIDIDHFKNVNDQLGHTAGDHCLREVATALREALDVPDVLGRYGGEEFVVLLPERGGAAARELGERLRAAVERRQITWKEGAVPLTVSVGVATRLEQESTPAAAVERADKALYAAKRGGRNCVHVAPAAFA